MMTAPLKNAVKNAVKNGRRPPPPPAFYVGFAADGRVCGCHPVRRDSRRALARFATALLVGGGRLDCLRLNARRLSANPEANAENCRV
jgi:hypothetical protein